MVSRSQTESYTLKVI